MSQLRLKNFQSFGPTATEIELSKLTFILGPNGAGKTAALVALARLFSPLPALRRVQPEDFHVPTTADPDLDDNELWIEVDIEFEEAVDEDESHPSVPPFFTHMALEAPDDAPRVRIRLTATLDADGYIDEKIEYITQVDADGEPTQRSDMLRHDRAAIEVHYLPARHDPVDHIAYTTASLLGRMLRAADWTSERAELARLTDEISTSMASNDAVTDIGAEIQEAWAGPHKGAFFKDPAIAFGRGEIEGALRQLTVTFAPGPAADVVGFERLSDGQKSLLYISLVLAWQGIARKVLSGEETAFDPNKLRPPVHVVIALEEPENSLAPQYLGRIVRQLREACDKEDVQGVVATHAPALLHRVEPEDIRFPRLAPDRTTIVGTIVMPADTDEAAKYVREAVLAYPELYFSRLVVLGEGDSEQIVLPRVLPAAGIAEDDVSVCVVPLGGRHVNHFWRLLEHLEIPYVTLLDLDCGRYHPLCQADHRSDQPPDQEAGPGDGGTLVRQIRLKPWYRAFWSGVPAARRRIGVEGGDRRPVEIGEVLALRKYVAELLGTAVLICLAVGVATLSFGFGAAGGSVSAGVVATALTFGLVLVALAYVLGPVSGCHVNPAVTLGALVSGSIGLRQAVGYWVAQFVGGILGALVLWGIFSSSPLYDRKTTGLGTDGWGTDSLIHIGMGGAFGTEVLLTAVFVFVVLRASSRIVNKAVSGTVIGLSLAMVHLIGIPITGTSVNPARSLGPALITGGTPLHQVWLFIVAPLVGAVVGAVVHLYFGPAPNRPAVEPESAPTRPEPGATWER